MGGVWRAFASELVKLRPLRRVGLLCLCGAATLAGVVTVATAGDGDFRGPGALLVGRDELEAAGGLGAALGGATTLLGVVALSLTAWGFGQEYANRTLPGLMVRLPSRAALLGGKLAATLCLVAIGIAVAVIVGGGAATATALIQGIDTSRWWSADGLADAAGTGARVVVSGMIWAIAGACLAMLLRSPVAAIGVGLAYALPVENLFTQSVDDADMWMPGSLLTAFAQGGEVAGGLGRALAVVVVEVGALAAITAWVFARRLDDA